MDRGDEVDGWVEKRVDGLDGKEGWMGGGGEAG